MDKKMSPFPEFTVASGMLRPKQVSPIQLFET